MLTKFVFCFYLFVMATIKKELGAGGGGEGGRFLKKEFGVTALMLDLI